MTFVFNKIDDFLVPRFENKNKKFKNLLETDKMWGFLEMVTLLLSAEMVPHPVTRSSVSVGTSLRSVRKQAGRTYSLKLMRLLS